MQRIEKMKYTIAHRKVFRKVERWVYSKVSLRGWLHDLDKVILYPILGVKLTSKLHRCFARHHVRRAKTKKNFREMVIDWECARFSKPDKPLNAYDILCRFYPQLEEQVIPILKEYGLCQSNLNH